MNGADVQVSYVDPDESWPALMIGILVVVDPDRQDLGAFEVRYSVGVSLDLLPAALDTARTLAGRYLAGDRAGWVDLDGVAAISLSVHEPPPPLIDVPDTLPDDWS